MHNKLDPMSTGAETERELHHSTLKILLAALVTLILMLCAIYIGRYDMTLKEAMTILFSPIFHVPESWTAITYNVIFRVRIPRICGAVLVGGGLALSGTTYQGIFQNPLVSPDLLGISAGACVGAASAILLNFGNFGVQTFALMGGVLAVFCSLSIPRILKNDSTLMLVLSGVIVSGFMTAMIGVLKYMADIETQLPAITYWQMGSLADSNPESVLAVLPAMLGSIVVLLGMSWRVNLLSLGDTESATLGINLRVTRTILILAATLLTGCAVCISGIVGWVGLIIPHLSRLIVGPSHPKLMPMSFCVGASFMLIVDTLARTLIASEIPLSILTGSIGAPLFIWLLFRTKTRL